MLPIEKTTQNTGAIDTPAASGSKVFLIAIIAATGGLLFGFDTGVISGALPFLKDGWKLTDSTVEWITTAVLLGAVLGAVGSGKLSDSLGRKKMIIITALIFVAGALGCALATGTAVLIFMRVIVGIAIGITSYVAPMYIAEISPKRRRGALVTLNQLMITIGILISFITDYLLSDDSNPDSWRWMFAVGFVPALILLIGMFFLPETPRWLASKGRWEESRKVLAQVEDADQLEQSFADLKEDVAFSAKLVVNSAEVFRPWLRPALIITIGIFFFQQFSGVNTIIYYSPIIFKMAGIVSNTASIIPSIIIGLVNVLACLLSVFLLDRVGRRKLFLVGICGMIPSLALLGLCFHFKEALGPSLPVFSVLSIVCYIIFIAISLAPLGWLLISEVFPLSVRGVGMSIGSLSHWGFNAVISFTFLKLVNSFGIAATFWFYSAICIAGLVWGFYYIPETKGKSLEDIEKHWRSGGSPRTL